MGGDTVAGSDSAASSSSNGAPAVALDPRLHTPRIMEKKRWHSIRLMEGKEGKSIAELIALPPVVDPMADAIILDSIVDYEIELKANQDGTKEKKKTTEKNDRRPWHPRKHLAVLDPPKGSSHWYTDHLSTRFLWLANSNLNSNVKPAQVEAEFADCPGYRGYLSVQNRPYILLIFEVPSQAQATWTAKIRTYGEKIEKEVLLDFAREPLPAAFQAALASSSFAGIHSSLAASERPVLMDDWRDIPGLLIIPDFLDEAHEQDIIRLLIGDNSSEVIDAPADAESETIEDEPATLTSQTTHHISSQPSANWIPLTKRRVQHYGYAFNYLTKSVDPSQFMGPLPEFAQRVVGQLNAILAPLDDPSAPADTYYLEKSRLAEIIDTKNGGLWKPDQLTINEYRPGQGIPHHIDTHSPFEEIIISVSIMADTVMEFCHPEGKKGRKKVLLPRRSLLALTGDARYLWTHGITPRTTDQIKGRPVPRHTRISLTFRNVKKVPSCKCNFPPQCDLWRSGQKTNHSKIESQHVHDVYDQIASHFDKTRYKPWPRLVNLLMGLRDEFGPTPLICDVGCGNGRYMGDDIYPESGSPGPTSSDFYHMVRVGGDRSWNLAKLSAAKGFEVAQFDCLMLPYRSSLFDCSICIAVIHHLSTVEHRVQAIEELTRITKVGGKIAVFVWALNQAAIDKTTTCPTPATNTDSSSASSAIEEQEDFERTTARSFGQQDIFVPWTIAAGRDTSDTSNSSITLQRYLHVYRNRELAELVDVINKKSLKLQILEEGIDHGNCFVILRRIA
jgi:alkylated DNA repair protein alkB family protein 8